MPLIRKHMAKVEIMMDTKSLLAQQILNLKLIKLSWALFFILIGGSWILEDTGAISNSQEWAFIYMGSGGILLLLNGLRIIWNIKISRFTTGLGALGLFFGITKYYNLNIPVWASLILIIGVFMLFEVFRK